MNLYFKTCDHHYLITSEEISRNAFIENKENFLWW